MKIKPKEQSLLASAFDVLLKNLGPQKTSRLWQVLVSPRGDYAGTRKKVFFGKSAEQVFREAKKFNRT